MPSLSRAAHRDEIAALPPAKIEAKPEPAASEVSREGDTKKGEKADTGRQWQTIEEETGELKS